MILKCSDFGLSSCCADCKGWPIVIYPPGLYGAAHSPDLGMGIRGEICCTHLHPIQKFPRNWWYEKYLRGSGRIFLESEIQRALLSNAFEHHKVYGEIHQAARLREQGRLAKQPRLLTQKTGFKKCPECGSNWNETICNNCGHDG